MNRLRRILDRRITSDVVVFRVARGLCFAAAPILFLVALTSLARFASSPFEVLLGVLASSSVSLLLVLLGLVVPSARGDVGS